MSSSLLNREQNLGIGTWCIEELPSIPTWKLGKTVGPRGPRDPAPQTYYFSNFFLNSIDHDIIFNHRYYIGMIILYTKTNVCLCVHITMATNNYI